MEEQSKLNRLQTNHCTAALHRFSAAMVMQMFPGNRADQVDYTATNEDIVYKDIFIYKGLYSKSSN